MTDVLDENGLQVKTLSEITTDLEDGFKAIYGDDINVESNSPDGQVINLLAQSLVDVRELITSVNNGFNPNYATGRILDERVVINNITRKAGTYTIVPIDIETDREVTLDGLDADFADPAGTGYTIQDDAGNKFILIDSATLSAGTTTVNFRAEVIGEVLTTTNTITNPVTIVLGILSVNNPSGALQTGENEESDADLRVRRQQSVANGSQGFLDGLQGTLLDIDGVSEAKVYENNTNVTDADGIPPHSIWTIVEGGANEDIGQIIYSKKSYGCGMKGAVEVEIDTASGGIFTAKFDRPDAKDLYIRFDIQPTATGATFDQTAIKNYIVENLSYNIGDPAYTSTITCVASDALRSLDADGVPVNVEISDDNATWVDYLEVDALNEQWVVDATRITITEL